jgi:hypothetical protein
MSTRSTAFTFIGSTLAISLCGCVPFVDDVLRPEGSLVKSNEVGNCVMGGADLTHVTLDAHIRVDFSPIVTGKGTDIAFDVFVPRNVGLRFDGRQVSLETGTGVTLKPMEYIQGKLPAPTEGSASSLYLMGGDNKNMYGRAYSFKIRLDTAPIGEFAMTLPPMHVGEHALDPLVIHYRRRHLLGVAPLMCG